MVTRKTLEMVILMFKKSYLFFIIIKKIIIYHAVKGKIKYEQKTLKINQLEKKLKDQKIIKV